MDIYGYHTVYICNIKWIVCYEKLSLNTVLLLKFNTALPKNLSSIKKQKMSFSTEMEGTKIYTDLFGLINVFIWMILKSQPIICLDVINNERKKMVALLNSSPSKTE